MPLVARLFARTSRRRRSRPKQVTRRNHSRLCKRVDQKRGSRIETGWRALIRLNEKLRRVESNELSERTDPRQGRVHCNVDERVATIAKESDGVRALQSLIFVRPATVTRRRLSIAEITRKLLRLAEGNQHVVGDDDSQRRQDQTQPPKHFGVRRRAANYTNTDTTVSTMRRNRSKCDRRDDFYLPWVPDRHRRTD